MPIFKLESYPYVCRLCLNPEQPGSMTSLDIEDECFEGGTLEGFLAKITFQVEEEKRHLFPRSICPQCKHHLRMFAHFLAKIRNVHLFMNALVELRDFNQAPIKDLFQTKPDIVRTILAELDLCHKVDCKAEDLIDEFSQFQIAQLPATSEDTYLDDELEMIVKVEQAGIEQSVEPEDHDFFAEECPLEELTELTKEIIPENVTSVDDDIHVQEMDCKFLEESDEEVSELTREHLVSKEEPTTKRRKYKTKNPKEPLQCPKCPYRTLRKGQFNLHQQRHLRRENRSFACSEPGCTENYASRKALQNHMMKAKHTAYVCEICGHQCSSNAKLNEHIARAHSNELVKCEYCEKTFKVEADLKIYVKRVHLSETTFKFKCETCGTVFKNKTALQQHQATHSDVYNVPCQQCDKKFKNKKQLSNHVTKIHKRVLLECEHCSRIFANKWMLLDHIEDEHKIRMRFFCDICVDCFDSQDKLTAHRTRHDNPKNLECRLCLIVFSSQEQLSDHMCLTFRDDYICCGKNLYQHVQYNRHMHLKHGVITNARVKPDPDVLLGQMRNKRKQIFCCPNCKTILPTRAKKRVHLETCLAGDVKG